jgi:hypothetical protein
MSKAKALAIWQAQPCPSWCTAVHDDADPTGSREHIDTAGVTPLTYEEPLDVPTADGPGVALDTLHVDLIQPHGASPRIVVSRGNGAYTTMSLDEAEDHALKILARVKLGRATNIGDAA